MTKKIHDDVIYGRTALREGLPWIVPESLDKLNKIIQPDWKIFEWGAGGSTVYFAGKCKFVVSVEHNTIWYDNVTEMLLKRNLRRSAHLCLVRGLPPNLQKQTRFRDYANFILSYPDAYFDLVFVDGEASSRGWCVRNAEPKVKPGGYLLLDNSDWLKREIEGFEREDYVARDLKWVGQKGTFNWWTSILKKHV